MNRCLSPRSFAFSAFAFLTLAFSVPTAPAQVVYSTVALTGQPAPGTPAGITFSGFIWPLINNSGHVAFTASLTGNGIDTDDTGIWTNSTGSLALVARAGMAAPGSNSFFDVLFGIGPAFDSTGAVTFSSSLVSGGSGVWSGTPGALSVVALSGMHAPGAAGTANFSVFYQPLSADGNLSFAADLTGADTQNSNHGIWAGTVSNLQLAARCGSPAPGTAAGTTFSQFLNNVGNGVGQVAFVADLTITSPAGTDRGVWCGTPSALSLVARRNNPAHGTTGVFSDFGTVALNHAGHVLFDAAFTIGGTTGSGLWAGAPGALTLVTAVGVQAPGMPNGTTFTSFYDHHLNATDRVVLYAYDSTNSGGLWTGSAGALTLIAHEGMTAPGTSGALFSTLSSPEINGAGEVAFTGTLESGEQGIWMTNSTGAVQLVALQGSSLPVGAGDNRVVFFPSLQAGGGNEDGLPSSLSDSGTLAFHALFADNSAGVFTATASVPPIRVSSVQKTGTTVQVKFFSSSNQSYTLQYKDSLTDSTWLPVSGSPIVGNGGIATGTDTVPANKSQRFYRVVQS